MRYAFIFGALILAAACAQPGEGDDTPPAVEKSLSALAHQNQSNFVNLSVGMKKAEVVKMMGRDSAHTRDGLIANPYRIETFQDKQGTQIEVLYYVTERNRRFQPLRLSNATPLVFRNGVLVGWGPEALRAARISNR